MRLRKPAHEADASDDALQVNLLTLERDLAQVAVDELASGVDPQLRFDVARAQKRVDEIRATIAKAELVAPMTGRLVNFSSRSWRAGLVLSTL